MHKHVRLWKKLSKNQERVKKMTHVHLQVIHIFWVIKYRFYYHQDYNNLLKEIDGKVEYIKVKLKSNFKCSKWEF